MKAPHEFVKFIVDLVLVVFWIWVPMFQLGLHEHKFAIAIWIVDILTLGVLIYWLHTSGSHGLRAK